ncbi:glyoxalase (plasmid) [Rhizobium sp. T1470]|uniref:VOC family protein n=1 Tax=unclassified Rhizobium TaxID=2613769 RepID=UPI001AAE93B3|nr:glyoxalase [Rhizobium sp. T1473]MCA0805601.1 glyoxalase [Rhizobium sp. T1473]
MRSSLFTTLSLVATLSILPAAGELALARENTSQLGVAPQYDTTHVYVDPRAADEFTKSFLGTFGGESTKQVTVTVTPTPSTTTSQLLQTPFGTVSLFGFTTPIPYPFGSERTGYLVRDMDKALSAARAAGAIVLVDRFPDPIGRDAVIQWPGGVNMQLYWHNKQPDYKPFATVPENRVYVSPDAVSAFVKAFLSFSKGKVISDDRKAPGIEIGRPDDSYRRIRISSIYGRMIVLVTDGHLPYPYGHETTGYEVSDLAATLDKAKANGARLIVEPYRADDRQGAMVEFPGGYVAEIHAPLAH